MQTFGEQLAAARKAKGMTQEELAQAANVARNTVSSWERDRTQPDLDMIRRLSDLLGVDFSRVTEAQSATPVMEETQVAEVQPSPDADNLQAAEVQTAPAAAGQRRIKKWWIVAGVAALICAVVFFSLLFPRKSAPAGAQDVFNVETYRQVAPNEADKAYLTFDNRIWDEKGENETYQHYCFTMREKNGIGYNISRVELQLENSYGGTRSATYAAKDMRAASLNPDITPYGEMPFEGGFPKGQFLRVGIAVYGTDANGAPMVFYSLIEF